MNTPAATTDTFTTAIYEIIFEDGVAATLTIPAACKICKAEKISALVYNADDRPIFECGRDGYAYAV
ncbi:MAG: hypothetical protein RIT24_992 [Planctomycetota bacterium]|jgi:hypothetical protein